MQIIQIKFRICLIKSFRKGGNTLVELKVYATAMKYNQILYFIKICQTRSISKAAEMLHVSQPALSKAILSVENELGLSLFKRTKSGMDLTKEGEMLFTQALRIVDEMNNFDNIVAKLRDDNQQEVIRIGIPPLFGNMFINVIESGFAMDGVNSEIVWTEAGTSRLMELIDAQAIDVALIASGFVNLEKYRSEKIAKCEEVICTSKDHRLRGREISDISELQNENFIVFDEAFEQGLIFDSIKLKPKKLLATSQLFTAVKMVYLDKGIFLLHKGLVEEYELMNKVGVASFNPPLIIELDAVWLPEQGKKKAEIANKIKRAVNPL